MSHTRLTLPPPLILTAIVSIPAFVSTPASSPSRSLVVPDTARTVPLNMSAIGSVFLGDVQRHRVLSSSTPPSSPPPHHVTNAAHSFSDLDDADEHKSPEAKPPSISPMLSLELRLRWLETLLLGAKHDDFAAKPGAKADKLKDGETIARRAEDLQRRLDGIALSNDALKRFMDRCEFPTFSLICARWASMYYKYHLKEEPGLRQTSRVAKRSQYGANIVSRELRIPQTRDIYPIMRKLRHGCYLLLHLRTSGSASFVPSITVPVFIALG